jgi:hypothetical protein
MSDVKKIKAFVQEVLGCGCSEDVFRTIEETGSEYKGERYSRINVGNRLLVYLFRTDDRCFIIDEMGQILQTGLEDRDQKGFNRFRLVYAVERPAEARGMVEKAFDTHKTDDRTHVHVVDRSNVEF